MKISFVKDGPIVLQTDEPYVLRSGESEESNQGRLSLCRCGKSSKKPFCDGSHRTAGFQATACEVEITAPGGTK